MSAFNKCKDCGSTNPPSGWLTKSKSLCVDCADTRNVVSNGLPERPTRTPEQQIAFDATSNPAGEFTYWMPAAERYGRSAATAGIRTARAAAFAMMAGIGGLK